MCEPAGYTENMVGYHYDYCKSHFGVYIVGLATIITFSINTRIINTITSNVTITNITIATAAA